MPISSEGYMLPAPSSADRRIANASAGHCTGFMVLGAGAGVRVSAESLTEQRLQKILDARPDVAGIREQVRFTYGYRNEHDHYFDILVTTTAGERIACTVKPEVRLASGRFVDEMQTVAWWVQKKKFAQSVRLLTDADIDRVQLHNANLNAALHDADPEAEAAARAVVGALRGAVAIKVLSDRIGLGARGHQAVLRLIARGELCPVRHERITPQTLVERKGHCK